jgi:NAD(P)H-dependent FMN reductase
MSTRKFLFLLASARKDGNTEALARRAATYLPAEVDKRWIRLSDVPLPPFEDIRHIGDGRYLQPVGNERLLLDATLEATDLVVASPLYWYSLSASAKLYFDYWAAWLRVPGADFKARMRGKTIWAVSSYSDEDVAIVDPLLGALRLSADYMGMRWGGELLTFANRPADVFQDTAALARAETFFGQTAAGGVPAAAPGGKLKQEAAG